MQSPLSSVAMHRPPSAGIQTSTRIEIQPAQRSPARSSSPSSPSSPSSQSSPSPSVPSRLSRRPPQFTSHREKRNNSEEDDDDEEDDEPAFKPLASTSKDPPVTFHDDARNAPRRVTTRGKGETSQTSDSSTSSTSPVINRGFAGQRRTTPGPLSPRRTAELSARKENSDGSPSIGSSFSDLDGMPPSCCFDKERAVFDANSYIF